MKLWRWRIVRSWGGGKAGFTLVEMVVIVSILGMLAAVLLPAFSNAREQARQVSCASKLFQIGLGIRQYVADYNGYYPLAIHTIPNCTWVDRLYPYYVHLPEVFECPSSNASYVPGCPGPTSSDLNADPVVGAYAMNDLRQGKPTLPISRFRHPESTIIVLDGRGMAGFVNPGRNPINSTKDLTSAGVVIRHGTGDNLLFADQHVKWRRLEAMLDRNLWLMADPPASP